MRNITLLPALASVLLLTATAAASQDATPSAPSTEENGGAAADAPKPKAKKPKKICRDDEHAYSRMPTRTCRTQAEWDALESRSRGNRDIPSRATN